MIYVILYLVLGIPYAVFHLASVTKRNWISWGFDIFIVLPTWPLWLALALLSAYRNRICGWCGERIAYGDKEKLTAHMRVCKKHPLNEDIRSLQAEIKELKYNLTLRDDLLRAEQKEEE